MRTMLLFLTVMVALTLGRSQPVQVEPCPPYDVLDTIVYLPHPHDCSLFRRCQAGESILGHCPQGQEFNPTTAACDDPSRAGCTAVPPPCTAGTPETTCRYQCTCTKMEDRVMCPARLDFPTTLEVFPWTKKSPCTRDPEDITMGKKKLGHLVTTQAVAKLMLCHGVKQPRGSIDFQHFADCAKMVRCEGRFEAVVDCPRGLLYDSDLGYCEDPSSVDCGTVFVPPGGCPTEQPVSSCPYTCDCKVSLGKCPAQLTFSSTVNITDGETHPDCRADPSLISLGDRYLGSLEMDPNNTTFNYCPPSSLKRTLYVPDLLECGRMFRCRAGKGKPFTCPKGYQYDITSNSCKRNPNLCKDNATSAAGPPPPPDRSVAAVVPCPSAAACPPGSGSRVAHLTDCTLFCECVQGSPILGACPPGLHFSSQTQACDSPQNARCQTFCSGLPSMDGGAWTPAQCNTGDSLEGAECRLQCDSSHQLVGSDVINCTSRGWHGSGGLNQLPSCNTTVQVAQIILSKINQTMAAIKQMDQKAGMLFVLDESGSVEAHNFEIEKNFVEALVTAFPLTQNRSSGVITFSGPGEVTVDISLRQTSTCDFLDELKAITYEGGFTDMSGALSLAKDEIDLSSASGHKATTLVFAITDGLSQSDPADAAKLLRDEGHTVFTIGVADYDRHQLEPLSSTYKDGSKLFFGLPDFQVFSVVAEYLRTTYQSNATQSCS